MLDKDAPKEVRDYFQSKGYKIGWDWRDVWKEEHARAFTVAKAMSLDLLKDIRQEVDNAIVNGITLAQFKKDLEPLLAKKGWLGHQIINGELVELGTPRRLKVIYDTNLRVARAAGQWERIERNKKVMPYLIYTLGPSRDHRPDHEANAGVLLPVDHEFWNTHYPPNGYGCRCRVRQLSKAQAERLGGETKAPKPKLINWKNKRTGKTEKVPEGTDPGWNYNPAKYRASNPFAIMTQKVNESPYEIAKSAISDLVLSKAFEQWMSKPMGNFPIAVIPEKHMQKISAMIHTVELSSQTLNKQFREHPELEGQEYRMVQLAIDKGESIVEGKNLIFILEDIQGYVVVVKTTETGKGLFLTSLRRLSSDEARRDREIKRLGRKVKK